jgi:hypothetical protein
MHHAYVLMLVLSMLKMMEIYNVEPYCSILYKTFFIMTHVVDLDFDLRSFDF